MWFYSERRALSFWNLKTSYNTLLKDSASQTTQTSQYIIWDTTPKGFWGSAPRGSQYGVLMAKYDTYSFKVCVLKHNSEFQLKDSDKFPT